MTPEETKAAITYAHGIDARVQMTQPNAELWGQTLASSDAGQVRAAILIYYQRQQEQQLPPITGPMIRRVIAAENDRAAAHHQALAASSPTRHPSSFRARNPEVWDRLVTQGREERIQELTERGIR